MSGYFQALPQGAIDAMDVLPRGLKWTAPMVINDLRLIEDRWRCAGGEIPRLRELAKRWKWSRPKATAAVYDAGSWAAPGHGGSSADMVDAIRGRAPKRYQDRTRTVPGPYQLTTGCRELTGTPEPG